MDMACAAEVIRFVDYVVIFDEETLYNLIKAIKPHELDKSGDYNSKKVIGENIIDELKIVDFVKDKGTSITIQKIKDKKSL